MFIIEVVPVLITTLRIATMVFMIELMRVSMIMMMMMMMLMVMVMMMMMMMGTIMIVSTMLASNIRADVE